MNILAMIGTVKDWADLTHALAWPVVVLLIVWRFRKSIDQIDAALRKVPWDKLISVKAANMELTIAQEMPIPVPPVPPVIEAAPAAEGQKEA